MDEIYLKFRNFKEIIEAKDNNKNTNNDSNRNTNGNSSNSSSTNNYAKDNNINNNKDKDKEKKYYVAVLDLEKCYDNVDTTQLYDLIKEILSGQLSFSPNDDFNSNNNNNNFIPIHQIPKEDCIIQKITITHYIASMERV